MACRTFLKRLLLALPLLGATAAATAAPAPAGEQELVFEIQRDGSPVGTHRVVLTGVPQDLHVQAQGTIVVRLLGIPVYRFDYRSDSRWVDGRMVRLDAATDDDGDKTKVTGRAVGADFEVEGQNGTVRLPAGIFPTDHWNPAVIGSTQVLNTITGRPNRVRMVAEGAEERPTGQGPRMATRYVYSGELDATVWYDARGSWVGLRFKARDGSTIDYVCRRCGPVVELAEQPK